MLRNVMLQNADYHSMTQDNFYAVADPGSNFEQLGVGGFIIFGPLCSAVRPCPVEVTVHGWMA